MPIINGEFSGNVIKIYEISYEIEIRIDELLKNLEKANNNKFDTLCNILFYEYRKEEGILYYIAEELDKGSIHEYNQYSDYELDFWSDFSSVYSESNFRLDKTIDKLINEYSRGEDVDESVFSLDKYTDDVKEDLIKYFNDLANCQKELYDNGFKVDPIDDNMGYDHKLKIYKCLDYV